MSIVAHGLAKGNGSLVLWGYTRRIIIGAPLRVLRFNVSVSRTLLFSTVPVLQ